jgi:hypothetical protein
MAPTRDRPVVREDERFPTEGALCGRGDQGERVLHQTEAARPGGWALVSPAEATGRPARQAERPDQTGKSSATEYSHAQAVHPLAGANSAS